MIDTAFLPEQNKRAAILMRHADRNSIANSDNEYEPLNELGIANSIEFGKKLTGYSAINIFSSPYDRCIQTGKNILQGAHKTGAVSESEMLGEPGPFVFDRDLAREIFRNIGPHGTVKNLIAGVELAGIRPLAEGCLLLKDFILSEINAAAGGTLLIFVTHDAIVAPFISFYTGEKFDKENWTGFSDGAIIIKDEENLQMIRNGKTHAMC